MSKENELWDWFKELIIDMRRMNNEIMKEQNGIFIQISLIDRSIDEYVTFLPHSIDLRSGKCLTMRQGKWQEVDVKQLFYHKRVDE